MYLNYRPLGTTPSTLHLPMAAMHNRLIITTPEHDVFHLSIREKGIKAPPLRVPVGEISAMTNGPYEREDPDSVKGFAIRTGTKSYEMPMGVISVIPDEMLTPAYLEEPGLCLCIQNIAPIAIEVEGQTVPPGEFICKKPYCINDFEIRVEIKGRGRVTWPVHWTLFPASHKRCAEWAAATAETRCQRCECRGGV